MRLKLSLRNLVKSGLSFIIIISFLCGCSPSFESTYQTQDIENAIQNICKDEYKISVKAKLTGQTLWIYAPVEDIFVAADKPEKVTEKFAIEQNRNEFSAGLLKLTYSIKPIPEKEEDQQYKYNKDALEVMNNVWKVMQRVISSTKDTQKHGPKFFCLITADIKKGFLIRDLIYYPDLKKVFYSLISWDEYYHRVIREIIIAPQIIGDKEGAKINYTDIALEDFIAQQIGHRIKLKFQASEVEKNADIDKEIMKIVAHTMKIYSFKDFDSVELNNLLTKSRIVLDKGTVFSKFLE